MAVYSIRRLNLNPRHLLKQRFSTTKQDEKLQEIANKLESIRIMVSLGLITYSTTILTRIVLWNIKTT